MRHRSLVVALIALLPTSCGGGDAPPPDQGSSRSSPQAASPEPTANARKSRPEVSHETVRFTAADGEQRSGRLFGAGEVGVVLSHMGRPGDGQRDWWPFAERLASRGFRVLTYQGRPSLPETWHDVLGAVDLLRNEGAETVTAAGASIGAMASLRAAARPDSQINAVLWLAGVLSGSGYEFERSEAARLGCPMLVASGDLDAYGADLDARRLHRWTAKASELLIVDSDLHGTDILTEGEPDVAGELRRSMIAFIEAVAERRPAPC